MMLELNKSNSPTTETVEYGQETVIERLPPRPLEQGRTAKKFSVVFTGSIDPAAAITHFNSRLAPELASAFELLIVNDAVSAPSEQISKIARYIAIPPGSAFAELCMEAARQARGEYVLFSKAVITCQRAASFVGQVQHNGTNIGSTPEEDCIVVKRTALFAAGSLNALLGQARASAAGTTTRLWDTYAAQQAGLGHVLQIADRTAMLHMLPKNAIAAEIGVFKGAYSEKILNIAKPAHLHLIDAWPEMPIQSDGEKLSGPDAYMYVQNRFRDAIDKNIVTLHRKTSLQAGEEFDDGYFDWIYIDAGHAYEEVRADLNCWYPKIKRGGFITGHDYIEKTWYGVVRAVNEFLTQKAAVFIGLTQEDHGSRSWIVKKTD